VGIRANTLNIVVDCYAGYQGEETPRAFVLGDRRVEVEQVIDRWLAPDHRYFKAAGTDGHTYIIRRDPCANRWELAMFQASHASDDTRRDR
jgi:hypothetical protein